MNSFRALPLLAFLLIHAVLFRSAPADDSADKAGSSQEYRAKLERAEEQAFKEAAVIASPSIVRIDTVGGLDVVGRRLTSTAPTTGVVVSEDGYIISSAFNFLANPTSVLVTLPDGSRFPAETVATDRLRMLTLLKIDATGLKLPEPAPRDELKVGQWAIALGRTYDAPLPSISVGIISAVNRIWGKAIQTDAKVSPVNYGGPLVDVHGRVMGILVPLSPQETSEAAGVEWYDSGIGFAIPLEDVYAVLDRLKQGENLRPGLSGIAVKSSDLYAEQPVIDRVRYDSPADKAGFESGDTIEKVNGRPIRRLVDLFEELKSRSDGQVVSITVSRGDRQLTRKLTLVGELVPYEIAFLGILPVRPGTPAAREATDETGVGIRFVYPDSPAAGAGLEPGDLISTLNGEPVSSTSELRDRLSRLRPETSVELQRKRDGETSDVSVTLATVPGKIPEALPVVPPPADAADDADAEDDTEAGDDGENGDDGADAEPRTGRFTDSIPGYDDEFWAYVPETYSPDRNYSLLVWLHPQSSAMEATMLKAWQTLCELRGIILLAPKTSAKGGWTANQAEYVRDVIEEFRSTYSIAPARVAVHGMNDGGQFAAQVAFRYPELFDGVALASAALKEQPPEHSPEFRVQFHLIYGSKDPAGVFVQKTAEGLSQLKFPVTVHEVEGLRVGYPPASAVEEMARWIDALDRL